jgi:hypothetical protein
MLDLARAAFILEEGSAKSLSCSIDRIAFSSQVKNTSGQIKFGEFQFRF